MVGEGLVISCHQKAAGCGRKSKNNTTLPQRSELYTILGCMCGEGEGETFLKLTIICISFDHNTMWLLKCIFSRVQILEKTMSVF